MKKVMRTGRLGGPALFLASAVSGFKLTDPERADPIAFLNSQTDDQFLSDPRFSNPFDEQP